MSVILNYYVRILVLDSLCKFAQCYGTTNTSHILKSNFIGTIFNKLVDYLHIIFHSVNLRVCDTQSTLRNHSCLLGVLYRQLEVTCVVQTTERTYYINSLCLLNLVHQLTNICRNRVHTQTVQCTFEHHCLDSCLVERLCPLADCLVRIFTIKQVNLFECTSIGFNTRKASHLNYCRSNFLQLVNTRNIFTSRLPHIPVNQTKFYLPSHYNFIVFVYKSTV